jgi:hypothetical protein
LLGLVLAGCTFSEHPEPPLILPPSESIVAISISDARARAGAAESKETRDRGTIRAYMDRLAALNRGWHSPPDTFPGSGLTVSLVDSQGKAAVVTWIGENWLGGREFEPADGGKRLIEISPAEHARLLSVLGLPPDPPSRHPA